MSYPTTMIRLAVVTILVALVHSVAAESLRFSNGTTVELWPTAEDTGHQLQCRHSRAAMVQRVVEQIDSNGDGCVDLDEMSRAFDSCLSWWERMAMRAGSLIGQIETPESTMATCDRNADKRMCLDDLLITQRECASYSHDDLAAGRTKATCLCTCSSMDDLYKFVLDRHPCE